MFDFLNENTQRLLKAMNCELVECNFEPDHVHFLISTDPKTQPSKMVNTLKTVTSRLIRKSFSEHLKPFYWKPIFWSRSYCIVSTGGASIEIIKQYIQNQDGSD